MKPFRWPHALLVLIVLAGAAIRLWQARESLWLDELHTAWAVGGDLAEVGPRAGIGNQSPLFFWLEWLLVRLLGASELSLRLSSLVAGSLLPAALYYAGWRWTKSDLAGLAAAWLAVVDPKSIFYATEARPYALVELLAVVHVVVLVELLGEAQVRRGILSVAWVLVAALLFYLHYTTSLLLVAELIVAACSRSGRRLWPDFLAVFVLCLPSVPHLLTIFARRENWEAFIQPQPAWMIFTLLPWSSVAVVMAMGLIWQWQRRPGSEADVTDRLPLRPVLVALAWLLVPASLAWLVTSTGVAHLFFARYLMASAPAALLLTAMGLSLVPVGWLRGGAAGGLAVIALGTSGIVPQFLSDGRFIADRREDWRAAVAWLNVEHAKDPLPVLVRSGLIEADALRQPHDPLLDDYCLLPVTGLYQLNVPRSDLIPLPSADASHLSPEARQLVQERGGAWVVVRGSRERAEEVERQLGKYQRTDEPKQSFGNVQIFRLRNPEPEPRQPKANLPPVHSGSVSTPALTSARIFSGTFSHHLRRQELPQVLWRRLLPAAPRAATSECAPQRSEEVEDLSEGGEGNHRRAQGRLERGWLRRAPASRSSKQITKLPNSRRNYRPACHVLRASLHNPKPPTTL